MLEAEAQQPDGWLAKRLDKERRSELASIGRTGKSKFFAGALHVASLGFYTRRAPRADGNLAKLDSYRRVEHDLNFLEGLINAGTPPSTCSGQFPMERPASSDVSASDPSGGRG